MHFKAISQLTAGILYLLIYSLLPGLSQEVPGSHPVRIMFYNAENFFDTVDDSAHNDEEFLPGGVMRWTRTRYEKKVSSIYKTIIAAGEWDPPAIVGFCEVENRKVLEDIAYGTRLSGYNYGIIHEDSPDPRGIDVCMIYRKDLFEVTGVRSLIPKNISRNEFHTRSVLYVVCRTGDDTLHLLLNHWPSRRGGVLAGEDLRTKISGLVSEMADSIDSACHHHAKLIIMGDFNCGPKTDVIQLLVNHTGNRENQPGVNLVNMADKKLNGPGTYRYQGVWETIDQIIISEWLLRCNKGLSTSPDKFRIFNPDFLLVNDPRYPGQSPNSTFKGYRYQGGFSDHLPVILDLYQK
jgi:hypothetical protein